MSAIRPIAFALSALLTLAAWSGAQTTRPAPPPAVDLPGLDRLQQRIGSLDLSDDQKKQIASLKDEVAETIRGMAPELKDLSPTERREKVRAALGDVREKFMSILTPEQKAKLRDAAGEKRVPGRKPLNDLKADGKKNADAETPMVGRLREAVDALDLSPEQKTKTDAILDDARTQAKQIRQDAAGDRDAVREKAGELARSVREKLAAVLTPEQQKKLAAALPGARRGGGRLKAAPATKPADATKTPDPAAAKAAPASSQPAVGSPAPSFALTRLNGNPVTNKTFAGKPLVLAFGSLTSPSFRDRVPRLLELKNRYRSRANVMVVYTREAHPSDGWQVERNRDEKIEVPQPTTPGQRNALAERLRDRLGKDLEILVDDMNDATLKNFGDAPDGAAVIAPYGTLVGTQKFCDPSGLPRLIDEALREKH